MKAPAEAKIPSALLVSELFPPAVGGSAVLFHGVYSRLGGADVTVLADSRASSPPPGKERRGRCRVVTRPIATQRWGILHPAALRHHLRVARQIPSLIPPAGAVVHAGRTLPEGVAAMILRGLRGPRYICWAHGEDIAMARTSRELTTLTRWVYRVASAAIANSLSTARMLEDIGVPTEKVHVVYPAVDAARFAPDVAPHPIRRPFVPPNGQLLLSVGRLQRRKGHDLAIAAMAALREEFPDLRYVIVGDGAERRRLEELIAENRLEERIHLAGEVSEDELPAYYTAADIFLLPNRLDGADVEGFGIVFLEAASSEKPVIGGSSGGVPEAVADGQTGLLVSGTDRSELADAIRRLATSPELRCRMGTAGRQRVLKNFTWDRAAEMVSDLHAEITASGRLTSTPSRRRGVELTSSSPG